MKFKDQPLNIKLLSTVTIPLILVAILGIVSYFSIQSLIRTGNWVTHTQDVISEATGIEKLVIDMETGQRGFLITGKRTFLEPYNNAKKKVSHKIETLQKLVTDNPEQVERLAKINGIINNWLEIAAIPEIGLRRKIKKYSKDFEYLQELLSKGVGKSILDDFRSKIIKIDQAFKNANLTEGRLLSLQIAKDIVDMETGQRGFLVTGKKEFLEPYKSGQEKLDSDFEDLRSFAKENGQTVILSLVDEVKQLSDSWLKKAGGPEISAREEMNQTKATMKGVIALIENETGKKIIDSLRIALSEFKNVEVALMESRQADAHDTAANSLWIIVVGTPMTILFAVALSLFVIRTITRSVSMTMKAVNKIGSGDYSAKVEITSDDEIGTLGASVNKMVDTLNEAAHLANTIAKGDLSPEIRLKGDKDVLSISLQKMTHSLRESRDTEKRRSEQIISANQYKSEFLANMSHELRTPLNSILILSKLTFTEETEAVPEGIIEHAKIIHSAGSDLLQLINEVLDLSKIEAGQMDIILTECSVFRLSETMKDTFCAIAKEKRVNFEIDVAPDVPETIYSDQDRISQVLKNFLSNAFKFTENGSVTLEFQRQGSNEIAITVTDTGIGIPKEKHGLVFEAFKQVDGSTSRRYGGTGLGLSICQKIAEMLQGRLLLESEEGKGSRFTFILPEKAREELASKSVTRSEVTA